MKESSHNMGFCRLPFELLTDENLTASDAVVYAVLLDACTDALICTMALSAVIELSGLSDKTVRRCLSRLEQYEYIEIEHTGRVSTYKLADIIGLKRQKQKPIIRQSRHAPEEVPAPEEQQELKLKYGQFQTVELTVEQFDRLVSEFGETRALNYIRKLDEYSHEHGKQYSDCDFTIRKWIAEDSKKEVQKGMSDKECKKMQDYMSVTVGSDEYLKRQEERKERVQKYLDLVN